MRKTSRVVSISPLRTQADNEARTLSKRRASLRPPIVTPEELAAGQKLQAKHEELLGFLESLTHDALGLAWKRSIIAFQDNPTAETLSAMKHALFERSLYRHDTRARSQCSFALRNFHQTEVAEWARGIVLRNLAPATAALTKVRAVENERVQRITGRPLTHSDVVAAAERPVRQLEAIRASVEANLETGRMAAAPGRFLEMFQAVGTEKFDRLIDPSFAGELDELLAKFESAAAAADEEAAEFSDPAGASNADSA